jgi:hypothetical protein
VARLSSDNVTELIVVTVPCALRYAPRAIRYSFTTTVRLSVSVAAMATQCFSNMVPTTSCLQSGRAPRRTRPPARRRQVRALAQSTHARATILDPFPEGRRADSPDVAEVIRNVWRGCVLLTLRRFSAGTTWPALRSSAVVNMGIGESGDRMKARSQLAESFAGARFAAMEGMCFAK